MALKLCAISLALWAATAQGAKPVVRSVHVDSTGRVKRKHSAHIAKHSRSPLVSKAPQGAPEHVGLDDSNRWSLRRATMPSVEEGVLEKRSADQAVSGLEPGHLGSDANGLAWNRINGAFGSVVKESIEMHAGVSGGAGVLLVVLVGLCGLAAFAVSNPSNMFVSSVRTAQVSEDMISTISANTEDVMAHFTHLFNSADDEDPDDTEGETHTTKQTTIDDALEIPENVLQLAELLSGEGIDTSSWGQALKDLQDQLLRSECSLTYSKRQKGVDIPIYSSSPGPGKVLVRRLRLLVVKIVAAFPDGLCALHCVGVTDNLTGVFKAKKQECAKKINYDEDPSEVLPGLLLSELNLSVEWQQTHLRVVHEDTAFLESGSARGNTFPGLTSHYPTEHIVVKLDAVGSKSIDGKLNLPKGVGTFQVEDSTFIKDKTRMWRWDPISDEDKAHIWGSS